MSEPEDEFWPPARFVAEPVVSEIGVVPDTGYNPFNFSAEGDDLIFRFTAESFLEVLSSLRNGAFMTYGQDGERVYWEFLRNVEYPVTICASIISCLLTDTDVQEALAEVIATNPTVQAAVRDFVATDPALASYFANTASTVTTKILSQLELGRNILKPDECDPDYIFNEVSTLIFLLNSLTNDLFNSIEVASNQLERAQLLVAGVPGVGIAPFDELLGLADQLVENIDEDYNGAYDEAMYDELRCGLFCAVKNSCDLSINDAFAFYEQKLGESLPSNPVEGLLAVFQYLSNGDLPGDTVVYAMHLLVLAAMRAGGDYLGVDFARLGLRITAAGDEPDNDWEILCEDCPGGARWNLVPGSSGWSTETLTFIEADGDWDVWEAQSIYVDPPSPAGSNGSPVFSNGLSYYYGYNIKREDGGEFVMDATITGNNNLWSYWYAPPSLLDARHFPSTPVLIAQGNLDSGLVCRFRVKGS